MQVYQEGRVLLVHKTVSRSERLVDHIFKSFLDAQDCVWTFFVKTDIFHHQMSTTSTCLVTPAARRRSSPTFPLYARKRWRSPSDIISIDSPSAIISIQCTYKSHLSVVTSLVPTKVDFTLGRFRIFSTNIFSFLCSAALYLLPSPSPRTSQYTATATICKLSTCSTNCPSIYTMVGSAIYIVGQVVHLGIDVSPMVNFKLIRRKYIPLRRLIIKLFSSRFLWYLRIIPLSFNPLQSLVLEHLQCQTKCWLSRMGKNLRLHFVPLDWFFFVWSHFHSFFSCPTRHGIDIQASYGPTPADRNHHVCLSFRLLAQKYSVFTDLHPRDLTPLPRRGSSNGMSVYKVSKEGIQFVLRLSANQPTFSYLLYFQFAFCAPFFEHLFGLQRPFVNSAV